MNRGEPPPGGAWLTVEAVHRAAQDCLKNKGSRRDAQAFRMHYGQEVLALHERLVTGAYRPEPGIVFVTERPKLREVHAAVFRDRVVHHLLHALLAPRFEPSWSPRTFACRRGLGTHAAFRTLERLVHNISRRGARRAWALQLDVASFFPTLHKPTLLELLARRFSRVEREGPLFALARTLVEHDSTHGARLRGRMELFHRVPAHKRLGAYGPDRGLPVGNLTSQFFAGVYLAPLDAFVERTLGLGAYVRYMDDLVLVHEDRERLEDAHARIGRFLRDRLSLELRADASLAPVSEGIDFVGYVVRPRYSLPRRRVLVHLRERARAVETTLAARVVALGDRSELQGLGWVRGPSSVREIKDAHIERARAVWSSFAGHLSHTRGRRALMRALSDSPSALALLDGGSMRFGRRFARPRLDASFPAQIARLRHGSRGAIVLIEVGLRLECPSPRDAALLGLTERRRRGRRLVPSAQASALTELVARAAESKRAIVVAIELAPRVRAPHERTVRWLLEPRSGRSVA